MSRPGVRLRRIAELADHLDKMASGTRQLVALAGPPGSGKSHTAGLLASEMRGRGRRTAILPMDGYHYDDAVLSERGLLHRKGAPETFDVAGLAHALARLSRAGEGDVAVPVFDRALELSRAGARIITAETELVLVEGNYLILDAPHWSELAAFFTTTVFVSVPETVLRRRLIARWDEAGLDPAEGRRKVEENDLPNCRLVCAASRLAEIVLVA